MSPLANTLSPAVQDYLKAIYALTRSTGRTGTLELAHALHITPASVSNMLQKMDQSEPCLIDYQKRYGVSLTPAGEQAALRILRRHRLLEEYLVKKLGYTWDQVHEEAEALEHVISPFMEQRIALALGDPAFDPHGDPIPDRNLQLPERSGLVALHSLPVGARGVVRQVNDQREDVLAGLGRAGLRPGVEFEVLRNQPLEGAVQIRLVSAAGGQDQILGERISAAVLVEPLGV